MDPTQSSLIAVNRVLGTVVMVTYGHLIQGYHGTDKTTCCPNGRRCEEHETESADGLEEGSCAAGYHHARGREL